MPRVPRTRSVAAGLAALLLAGCGGAPAPVYPVAGRVSAGGRPVPNGEVVFTPADGDARGPAPRGSIAPDGTYTVGTDGRPGAPAGRYKVTVLIADSKEVKAPTDPAVGSAATTPLVVDVTEIPPPGGYNLNLDPRKAR